jgi:hypothetical protein
VALEKGNMNSGGSREKNWGETLKIYNIKITFHTKN